MIRRLLPDARGVAALEFALLAPAFFAFLFLILEGGRMIWTQQVLQETAFAAARCFGVRSTGCTSEAGIRTFAVARAGRSRVRVLAAQITATNAAATTCNGQSNMARVVISRPYSEVVGSILPNAKTRMTITACFPNLA